MNNDNCVKSMNFSQKEEGLAPLSPLIQTAPLLQEFCSTTEYLDALLTARNNAFLQQSKDDFKALKKFNQLLMK